MAWKRDKTQKLEDKDQEEELARERGRKKVRNPFQKEGRPVQYHKCKRGNMR